MSFLARVAYLLMMLVALCEAMGAGWIGFLWVTSAYCGFGPRCAGNAPAAYPLALATAAAVGVALVVAVAAWHGRSWAAWITAVELLLFGIAATVVGTDVVQGLAATISAPVPMTSVLAAGIGCLAAAAVMVMALRISSRADRVWWKQR